MLSIKPNPNYVPGGVENFWVTSPSSPEKKEERKEEEENSSGLKRISEEERKNEGSKNTSQTGTVSVGTIRGSFFA